MFASRWTWNDTQGCYGTEMTRIPLWRMTVDTGIGFSKGEIFDHTDPIERVSAHAASSATLVSQHNQSAQCQIWCWCCKNM
uniref:Uncharacterized protein n=1 Tax=Oryza punctata TaxID=4537 RepID=A0A0E0KG62_ORYPU